MQAQDIRKDFLGREIKPGDVVAYSGSFELSLYEMHSNTPTSIRAIPLQDWLRSEKCTSGQRVLKAICKYDYVNSCWHEAQGADLFEKMQYAFKPVPLKDCNKRVMIVDNFDIPGYREYLKYKKDFGF